MVLFHLLDHVIVSGLDLLCNWVVLMQNGLLWRGLKAKVDEKREPVIISRRVLMYNDGRC